MPRIVFLAAITLAAACSTGSAATVTTSAPSTTVAAPVETLSPPVETTTTTPAATSTTVAAAPATTVVESVFTVIVEGGEVRSEFRHEVVLGEEVVIAVTSDVADEVHLHTYDVIVDVAAGETALLEFEATIPGIFEVELESTHLQILELVVQ